MYRGEDRDSLNLQSGGFESGHGIVRSGTGYIEGHRWPLSHLAGRCFAGVMRLLPQRLRFTAALMFARVALPIVRRTEAYREQKAIKIDGDQEIALHFVLSALTKSGVAFDPVITVTGYQEVSRALASGSGVLMIGPHAALILLIVRLFYDKGLEPVVISADPLMRIGGTRVIARTLQPSTGFLVEVLSLLRSGRLICALPDRAEHHRDRTIEFETTAGPFIIAPALMQVAARCGAKVLFMEMHAEGGRLVATICSPADSSEDSGDGIVRDFIEFVRTRIDLRLARCSSA